MLLAASHAHDANEYSSMSCAHYRMPPKLHCSIVGRGFCIIHVLHVWGAHGEHGRIEGRIIERRPMLLNVHGIGLLKLGLVGVPLCWFKFDLTSLHLSVAKLERISQILQRSIYTDRNRSQAS